MEFLILMKFLKKLSLTINDLCDGLPIQIRDFIAYSWNLGFEQKPDYNYLRNLLINCNQNNNKLKISPSMESIELKNPSESSSFKIIDEQEFDESSVAVSVTVPFEEKNIVEREYINLI